MAVKIVNMPDNVVMISDSIAEISVTVSDNGMALLVMNSDATDKPIEVDFSKTATGTESCTISEAALQHLVAGRLPASVKVRSISPSEVEFTYNYGLQKLVPVIRRGQVSPVSPYFIASETITPDSVFVYASQRRLDAIDAVYTEVVVNNGFSDTLNLTVKLEKIDAVKVDPDCVNITFATDVLTEEVFKGIPIEGINVPKGKTMRTFPSTVAVRFVTQMSRMRHIKAGDFKVTVDYNDLGVDPSVRCKVKLAKMPEGIEKATLNLAEVDYLIEE